MKLYTKKGDTGETGILGKDRLPKDHARIEAYGTIDELNSLIGMAMHEVEEEFRDSLRHIQSTLFEIGTELASVEPKEVIVKEDIEYLEQMIDSTTDRTDPLTSFILPGGTRGSSWFHIARTVCRRAERRVVSLNQLTDINNQIIPYLNRLSDLFFAYARLNNSIQDVTDIPWEARS